MKIEKVNDHQIRCTLTKADLIDRELKISELTYGTEKAKTLFRDMMQQASFECGFEAENIPLMIEAIPLNSECIVLIITKVEDPEELDTRFSKFAPSVHDANEQDSTEETSEHYLEGADDVLDLFKKIHENKCRNTYDTDSGQAMDLAASLSDLADDDEPPVLTTNTDITKVFSFPHLSELTRLAHILNHYYTGINSLYKNEGAGCYSLILSKGSHTPEEFNKICNIISEYGFADKYSSAGEAFLKEHCDLFIADNALQSLALI